MYHDIDTNIYARGLKINDCYQCKLSPHPGLKGVAMRLIKVRKGFILHFATVLHAQSNPFIILVHCLCKFPRVANEQPCKEEKKALKRLP